MLDQILVKARKKAIELALQTKPSGRFTALAVGVARQNMQQGNYTIYCLVSERGKQAGKVYTFTDAQNDVRPAGVFIDCDNPDSRGVAAANPLAAAQELVKAWLHQTNQTGRKHMIVLNINGTGGNVAFASTETRVGFVADFSISKLTKEDNIFLARFAMYNQDQAGRPLQIHPSNGYMDSLLIEQQTYLLLKQSEGRADKLETVEWEKVFGTYLVQPDFLAQIPALQHIVQEAITLGRKLIIRTHYNGQSQLRLTEPNPHGIHIGIVNITNPEPLAKVSLNQIAQSPYEIHGAVVISPRHKEFVAIGKLLEGLAEERVAVIISNSYGSNEDPANQFATHLFSHCLTNGYTRLVVASNRRSLEQNPNWDLFQSYGDDRYTGAVPILLPDGTTIMPGDQPALVLAAISPSLEQLAQISASPVIDYSRFLDGNTLMEKALALWNEVTHHNLPLARIGVLVIDSDLFTALVGHPTILAELEDYNENYGHGETVAEYVTYRLSWLKCIVFNAGEFSTIAAYFAQQTT
jgi:hypothetical protein